jgi:hypothetical protein
MGTRGWLVYTVKRFVTASCLAFGLLFAAGCSTDADVASQNLSVDAEQFKIHRRIVGINGVTDKYLLSIEGFCSVESSESKVGGSLEVTCKVGDNAYKKHFLGLSDNTTYVVEQLESANVSVYRYKVIFKPSVIIPDIDIPR